MPKYSPLLAIIVVTAGIFILFIGCDSDSIATAPVIDGIVNLKMQVVTKAPYGYVSAPQAAVPTTLVTDPVKDTELYGCALIISKVSLYTGNKEVPVFTARYREDGAVLLVDNGAGNQICNMVDYSPSRVVGANTFIVKAESINWMADVPEGEYSKMVMKIEEVCVTYKTSGGTLINWHDRSFNKQVVLEGGNQFSSFRVARNTTQTVYLKFNVSGRVGKTQGQFEPDVYLIGAN
ncbi:MAG: hypothetical protein PHQ23_05920 [Candidatus Wallbacteria bacterium]|nr:hypothetical protein [Candidatus Wallbacteria bacterium]